MFHLQYKLVRMPQGVSFKDTWHDFGQTFYTVQEVDLRALKRRFVNHAFRLQFRPTTKG